MPEWSPSPCGPGSSTERGPEPPDSLPRTPSGGTPREPPENAPHTHRARRRNVPATGASYTWIPLTGDRRPRDRSRPAHHHRGRPPGRRRCSARWAADSLVGAPRGDPSGGRRRGRPRRSGRGLRRGHRPRRRRRRTSLRIPLRPARLPGAAAPRGRGVRADRPGGLPRPVRTGRGPVRHRVDPARRHPGPAVPARNRHGAHLPVRHRAGRPPRRLPPGRTRRDGRECARLRAGEGPLRRRLVHPPASRAVAALRRAGRGAAGGPAGRPGEGAGPAGQARLGPPGVRRHRLRTARPAAQGPVAPYLRHAQGAPAPPDGGRTGAVGVPGPDRAAA